MNRLRASVTIFILLFLGSSDPSATNPQFDDLVDEFYAELYSDDGQGYADSRAIAEEMVRQGNEKDNDSWRVRGLIRLAFIELKYGKWRNEFDKKVLRCETLLEEMPNSLAHAEFNMFRGQMLGVWQDDIPGGIKNLRKAILIAEQLREDEVLSRSFSLVATMYGFLDDAKRLFEYTERAYVIGQAVDNESIKIETLTKLVGVLHDMKQTDRAIELAFALKELSPDSGSARWVLFCEGKDDEFLEVLKRNAAHFLKEPKENLTTIQAEHAATHNTHLAEAHLKSGQLESAEQCCTLAIEYYQISQNMRACEYTKHMRRLIEIMLIQKDPKRLDSLVKKLEDAGHINAARPDWCLHIAKAYGRFGQHERSNDWLKKCIELSKKTDNANYENIVAAARDYWDSELQARGYVDLVNEQKQKSQFAYYLLTFVTIAALSLMALSYVWIRGTRNQKNKLAEMVDMRTKSLVEANKKSNAANEAKSEFLARVNHEIRNPLTAILGYCDLLEMSATERGEQGSKQELFVSGLRASSRHLLELVDDVLVVSRIENSEIESNEHEFDLRETVKDIRQMMGDLATEKSLDFECSVEGDCATLFFGDETKLRQIVLNLLSNAIKFTKQGRVSALFCVFPQDKDKAILEVRVSDSGTGMPAELQPFVFDKFVRGAHQVDGTGLGLHICQKLVDHLDGTIDFKSQESGTSFLVLVPMNVVTGRKKNIISNQQSQSDVDPIRILVVDDQQSIRETVCMQLRLLGFESKSSMSLTETIDVVNDWAPQIVLLDLRMPDIDGFEVLRAIRTQNSNISIVAMTGDATDQVKQKCEAQNFDGFLTKPFRMQSVIDLVDRLVNAKKSDQETQNA